MSDVGCCRFSRISPLRISAFSFVKYRDFIHLIMGIRRAGTLHNSVLSVSVEILVHALERNFNGVSKENFSNTCAAFLARFLQDKRSIEESMSMFCRHPIQVLQDALFEVLHNSSRYSLPRFKMIIDGSNDDSIMRLLQVSVLDSSHLFYRLSGLDEGATIEQLKLVSRVKFAAQQGDKAVVLSQIDAVSECFYDLFNQHYKTVKKGDAVSYYANIAIGGVSRPSKIHPSFQCIVHVQSSELDETPAPYLNRFEKFELSVMDILSWQISKLPAGIGVILSNALAECEVFLSKLGDRSIWSSSPSDTLKSIFISMIPKETGSTSDSLAGNSISSAALGFIKRWFAVDITNDEIDQAIAIAVNELSGIDNIELKKVIEEGYPEGQGQLEQTFNDLATAETTEQNSDSPLVRSLESVVHLVIVRWAIIKLLQVALPEDIFLQR